MKRRVVVTGLGLVSPLGLTAAETWTGLVAGQSGAGAIRRFDPAQMDVRFACEVKGFDPLRYMDRKEAKRLDLFAQYAMAATTQAIADAGFGEALPNPDRSGVIIGSGIGGISTFEEQCKLYLEKGPSRVSPFFVPMFIPDIASGLVSIRWGAKGPNYCTVSACASSAHALGEAFRLVQSGAADLMIAGGAEAAVTPLAIAGFANMRALSIRNDEPERASRPFDKDRDGFVMGEGAGVLILEALEDALDRGATIRGELLGYGMSADAFHMTQPAPGGEGAKRAILACLEDGGIDHADVGYINSHGTSTPHGDIAETRAVKGVFGEVARDLVMNSTKSMTGHALGAAGALEASITLMTMEAGVIPPTINLDAPDPECDLDYAPNQSVERQVDVALSNSFGFGGHNVTLAFGRYRE
ncbi:MAG: beta-ketoacyl-ACP synthase II [Gemmatimonadota bacterium]|nr:beta-ketoacyl-ACP synthase II [Gemmatimonadota bacterium]MDH3367790.1 beta-ketoacyl-ACP synthase II [Gemmatimonadota bacterium]MDH3477152.1 beta-ketoacyl-ACP synthase II [Gemmatimonadota bacterium]MDH3570042.1 beta-ketoacyl-ACP synthase II [Gemmatimonadota bacterium]MDH5548538.1 beta-ketoacyl-ACP synthase II [Gemmatimonadota bacterium]